jgi:rod shape-determining protein MreB
MFFDRLFGLVSNDMAVDLGTATTLVYVKGQGCIANEPSVVAIRESASGRQVMAVGSEAKKMLGRTPAHITAIRPMKDGVIAEFTITEAMLKYFIEIAHSRKKFVRPRIIISVPSGVTPVEKRAVKEAAFSAGAREVYLIEEPMAAAIGAGLPVSEPVGNMIVDIGGGTTEVAVISLSGIVYSCSIKTAGNKLDEVIAQHIKQKYNILIGERSAELIKINIATAYPEKEIKTVDVKGRDLVAGIPRTIEVDSQEIMEVITGQLNAIVAAIKNTLEKIPPELSSDIVDRGIVLAGGGALLKNLDVLLKKETGLLITISESPQTAVAMGAGMALEEIDVFEDIAFN